MHTKASISEMRRDTRSDYIHWAKTRASARFNLASSGIESLPLADLPVRWEDIELSPPGGYGYAPLQERLAKNCGVPEEWVVAATGTSMANHLAMAGLLEAGDEVLIEQPAYDPLLAAAKYFGAAVRRFPRSFEKQFRVEPREVERAITPKTRLIVLTNLHNPSGARISDETLREVGEMARGCGAHVLVDEVYLDMLFVEPARSAIHLGEHFVITSSLTKAYGLSGLRCGWILAAPPLAERMWRLKDIFENIPAHIAERLSVIALDRLAEPQARAKALLDKNRPLLDRFLDSRRDLEAVRPPAGTIVFPRLRRGSADDFCRLLREKYDTSVVPGRFFEMPGHFRIGIGGDTATLAAGLERIGAALDEFHSK
ncbi:MAG TPA: pyridoxal phosphate-dependent aminotransferase [Candidatus Acidoferrales bacterium]|nr:pyridoxal phosphate-dependent aminotransferase [Candidatus Acidoferrales bacterium]